MLKINGQSTVTVHTYNAFPKARFTPGTVILDGQAVPVRVTCVGHAKFPAYTYWSGQNAAGKDTVFYVKGDLRDAQLETVVPPAPAAA